MNTLATIVYYPKAKTYSILSELTTDGEVEDFYLVTISRLLELAVFSASKYTQSKVRKVLSKEFAYILEELLSKDEKFLNKDEYYHEIITSLIDLDRAQDFIIAISDVIQRLVVDHLHVLGDIYDRGPYPDKIIDLLMSHHSLDITWGNHDILWMGAASGSKACVANAMRISARYDNLEIMEDVYGISLRHLLTFAEVTYDLKKDDVFKLKLAADKTDHYDEESRQLSKIQQALAVIQFKLEGAIIQRNPDFQMQDRLLLDKINYEDQTIQLDGQVYDLENGDFPTIDPEKPYELTEEEQAIIDRLMESFMESERLKKHVRFLINKGSMYLVYNENLLYHGCVPLNAGGSFMSKIFDDVEYSGKRLFDYFDQAVRNGFLKRKAPNNQRNLDLIWYLWMGQFLLYLENERWRLLKIII